MDAADALPAYAAAGLAVLPLHAAPDGRCTCRKSDCRSAGKHPRLANGKDGATTDLGVIAEWLARWPVANWGVRPPEGVVVLDVDPRHDGDRHLADLEQRHGQLPATLTARTGSGGRHIWLSHRGPARGLLCTGVDVKTSTGYLVVAPSVHECGSSYSWVDQRPAAWAPRWVRTILNPPVPRPRVGPGQGRLDPLVRFVTDSVEGQRNGRLFWASCRAVEDGLDPAPLIDAAVAVGLSTAEATATVRSAMRSPRRAA